MARTGRPLKLNSALQEQFISILHDAVSYEAACAIVGIDFKTYRNWMRRGGAALRREDAGEEAQANDALFADFFQAVKATEAQVEKGLLARVRAAEPGWQGSAWILERRWPERWGGFKHELAQVRRELRDIKKSIDRPWN